MLTLPAGITGGPARLDPGGRCFTGAGISLGNPSPPLSTDTLIHPACPDVGSSLVGTWQKPSARQRSALAALLGTGETLSHPGGRVTRLDKKQEV